MSLNLSKGTLILKILSTASHSCWNYRTSNLLFLFSDSCIGYLNKKKAEIAVMLTLPVLKSYTKMLKVSKIFVDTPQNGHSLKFLQNCTEMHFYLLIFFNIICFKHIFLIKMCNFSQLQLVWGILTLLKIPVYRKQAVENAFWKSFFRFSIFQI